MRPRHVCVTAGAARARSLACGGFVVTDAAFPAGAVLAAHTHERPIVAVVLDGAMETSIGAHRLASRRGAAWIEPAGEPHGNVVSADGARVMVVELGPAGLDCLADARAAFDAPRALGGGALALDALRLRRELERADDLTPLVVSGIVASVVAGAVRATRRAARAAAAPPWLALVVDALHGEFRRRLDATALARLAGVHPSHLAHTFRAQLGTSIGEYVRRLRVEWAAERLRDCDAPISAIAIQAGFSDQSHLTRELVRRLGVSPARLRADARGPDHPPRDRTR